jgi:hypothetical protein
MRNRNHSSGNQRAGSTANAIAPVKQTQHKGAVLETPAEDIAHGDVDGDAKADEEEGRHDDAEGGCRDEGDVSAGHEHLAYADEFSSAEFRAEGVEEDGGEDEAEGLADEDEGYDGVANVVVSGYSHVSCLFFSSFLVVGLLCK